MLDIIQNAEFVNLEVKITQGNSIFLEKEETIKVK